MRPTPCDGARRAPIGNARERAAEIGIEPQPVVARNAPFMIEFVQVRVRRADLHTRLPFKYGIAVLTETPHAFVEVTLRVDGAEVRGVSADHLPPKWFTKNPTRAVEEEIAELEDVVTTAGRLALGSRGAAVFDLWLAAHHRMEDVRKEKGWPPLLAQFGTSLVERAAIDAYCRAKDLTFLDAVRSGALGLRLAAIHPELAGEEPARLLPLRPLEHVAVRHTVGLADPLTTADTTKPLDDGLPETLEENIATYGLRHFKVKFTGLQDLPRLERIFGLIATPLDAGDGWLTLDGNESFVTVAAFREMWAELQALPSWTRVRSALGCVEQPFHRNIALEPETTAALLAWPERPPLIIDESDGEIDSLRRALAGGYIGTSHKNCKGVFRGVANACLLAFRASRDGHRGLQTGEDLSNIGPVALLQDLAVQAAIGIASVERNGHHYFRGLSFLPETVQAQVLAGHPDLYARHARGFPALRIVGGQLDLGSVNAAPFGVAFLPELDAFPEMKR